MGTLNKIFRQQTAQETLDECLTSTLTGTDSAIEEFDQVLVRQLVSNIKVLDKERILVRFKDGTEVEQRVERK